MTVSRRSFLGLVGVASAPFAGCISGGNGGRTDTGSRRSSDSAHGSTATETRVPSPATNTENGSQLRVEVAANESKYEYIESKNSVRYVAAYRHSNPSAVENGSPPTREPVYDTIPFERWVRIECASVGAKKAGTFVRDRLDGTATGISAGVTTRNGTKTIVLTRSTVVNRDGEVTATPSASYEQLKRIAPSVVVATISLADRRRTCTVPVRTENTTVHLE